MKRIIPHVLITLILLNVWGLYGVFMGMQFQNHQLVNDRIDQGAVEKDDIVVIKIPMALPYAYETGNFDRAEGTFESAGKLYRLIEKKLSNDTLTVLCIEDKKHGAIGEAMAEFAKTFNDHPGKDVSKESVFTKDYLLRAEATMATSSNYWVSATIFKSAPSLLRCIYFPIPTRPPELVRFTPEHS